VTKSILALKIYGIVKGVDIVIIINVTFKIITDQLGFFLILTIVCTNSYLLWECFVKLRTTKKKCLMINIIALY
jgi:hypothetical protein